MVDVNGTTPIGSSVRIAEATPIAAVRAPSTQARTPDPAPGDPAPSDLAQTSGLAQAMAASPPVDSDRVATIKKAIAEGRFPIVPAKIADRLIALRLQWTPGSDAGDD